MFVYCRFVLVNIICPFIVFVMQKNNYEKGGTAQKRNSFVPQLKNSSGAHIG